MNQLKRQYKILRYIFYTYMNFCLRKKICIIVIIVVVKIISKNQTDLSKINWNPSKEESLLNKKSIIQNKIKEFTEVISSVKFFFKKNFNIKFFILRNVNLC